MIGPEASVEEALLWLAGRHDDAAESPGFSPFDEEFGHAMAERVASGVGLTGKSRRAAHRMLRRYSDDLKTVGIDWARLGDQVSPDYDVTAKVVKAGQPPRASVERGRIVVRSPYEMKELCRSLPGARWSPQVPPKGAWTYPESATSALNVSDAFSQHGLVYDDAFVALVAAGREQRAAQIHKTAEDLPSVPNEAMPSWLHQRQAFWFAREQDAALLAMDMGTGKSKVAIDILRENGARRVLIMCPAKVLGVWPKQFDIHGGGRFHVVNGFFRGRSGDWSVGSVDARTRQFDEVLNDCRCGKAHVVVANYEITAHQPFKTWALEQTWDYSVLDESHRIRSAQGVWSKWCAKLRDVSVRRLCLTGTPLGQSPLDAFAQYRFLDPSIFGVSYTSFEHRYAVKGGYQGHEVLGMRTQPTLSGGRANPYYSTDLAAEFDRRFFSVAYAVGSEVLDLPSESDITRTLDLPRDAMKTYRQLDSDLYADLEAYRGGELSTPNVLVKMLRLQQLTGGAVNDDEGGFVEVHNAKGDLLEDILTDISPDEPVVVFCRFVHDLRVVERVAKKIGRPYYELSGGRNDAMDHQSTLKHDHGVVGVQIQAGGVGVDFTKARYAIYYSLGFSLIDYAQSRKRLHRPGQTRPVIFVHLVANDTIDEDVYDSLARNQDVVDTVMKRRLVQYASED